jgi:hypothetical protein
VSVCTGRRFRRMDFSMAKVQYLNIMRFKVLNRATGCKE